MKILNIHQREIPRPIQQIAQIFPTIATAQDLFWPREHWPAMKLNNGLTEGSCGGHGPIGYCVRKYEPERAVYFKFNRPTNFIGEHFLELIPLAEERTLIRHTIQMKSGGLDYLKWVFAIRFLHDALIEDAFDKVENHFCNTQKQSPWKLWVRLLRKSLS